MLLIRDLCLILHSLNRIHLWALRLPDAELLFWSKKLHSLWLTMLIFRQL